MKNFKLDVNYFDFNIKKEVKKLIVIANERIKVKRNWNVNIVFFDDGDYQIKLRNGWGNKTITFCYQKSVGEITEHVATNSNNEKKYKMIELIDKLLVHNSEKIIKKTK